MTTIIILAYGLPVMLAVGFCFGFKVASRNDIKQPLNSIIPPVRKGKKLIESKAQRMQRIYEQNIENYGTDVPQEEV